MSQTGEKYAASHMSHALMEALVAASTWACSDDPARELPYKLTEIAEYGAFMHIRGLLELFCGPERYDSGKLTVVGGARQLLGHSAAVLPTDWDTWHQHINRAAAHLARRHEEVDPIHDGEHLKDQVVMLAAAAVRAWMAFENELPAGDAVRSALEAGRATAFAESDKVTEWFKRPALDWTSVDPAASWIPLGLTVGPA